MNLVMPAAAAQPTPIPPPQPVLPVLQQRPFVPSKDFLIQKIIRNDLKYAMQLFN